MIYKFIADFSLNSWTTPGLVIALEKTEEDKEADARWFVIVMIASGGICLFVGLLMGMESIPSKSLVAIGSMFWVMLAGLAIVAVAVERSVKKGW